MAFFYLTDQTAGAPRNSGTNGDLNALLNWALVTTHGGWSREYNNVGSNESVFRAATGNRNRFYVRHDSSASGNAGLAVVRGCESAVDASTLVDQFPLTEQLDNSQSNFFISSTQSTLNRPFKILVWDTGFIYISYYNSSDADYGAFFDFVPLDSADIWNTCIIVRATNTSSAGAAINISTSNNPLQSANNSTYFVRDISGTIKSSAGGLNASGTFLGFVTGTSPIKGGYLNRIIRERIGLNCSGKSTIANNTSGITALVNRGYFPNMWNLVHSTLIGMTTNDVFNDSNYNPSASFTFVRHGYASGSPYGFFLETTNTWNSPYG